MPILALADARRRMREREREKRLFKSVYIYFFILQVIRYDNFEDNLFRLKVIGRILVDWRSFIITINNSSR